MLSEFRFGNGLLFFFLSILEEGYHLPFSLKQKEFCYNALNGEGREVRWGGRQTGMDAFLIRLIKFYGYGPEDKDPEWVAGGF